MSPLAPVSHTSSLLLMVSWSEIIFVMAYVSDLHRDVIMSYQCSHCCVTGDWILRYVTVE